MNMVHLFISRSYLIDFLRQLAAEFPHAGRIYLLGEASLLWEGWRQRIELLEFCAEVEDAHRSALKKAVSQVAGDIGIAVLEEFPGDVIPLPEGYAERHRRVGRLVDLVAESSPNPEGKSLELWHFDPYSVAFRFIARGDETDYHLVIEYLRRGWITVETMNTCLEQVLPRFSYQTIHQDPMEFRRKYKGLLQMWRARG
ncbi:MAG: hypothetical protein D6681_02770 [Calditrichaeota bacterium]|nr:MAG: hypothetical protein D6681_02770 [Calditrichota bacterium]